MAKLVGLATSWSAESGWDSAAHSDGDDAHTRWVPSVHPARPETSGEETLTKIVLGLWAVLLEVPETSAAGTVVGDDRWKLVEEDEKGDTPGVVALLWFSESADDVVWHIAFFEEEEEASDCGERMGEVT